MAHSPGPWRYAGERVFEEETDDVIAQPGENFSMISPSQTLEANARLIAAAPEMLDALEAIDSLLASAQLIDPEHDGAYIRAALKAARGES